MDEKNLQTDENAKRLEEEKAAVEGMHAEGIDIVPSGAAFDDSPAPSPSEPASKPQEPAPKPAENPPRLTAEQKLYSRPEAFVPPKPAPAAEQAPRPVPTPEQPIAEAARPSPNPEPKAPSLQEAVAEASGIGKPESATPKKPDGKNDPSIKPLRTFKSDAEEAIRYQNVSAIDIAVAAEKKRQESTPIEYASEKRSSPKAAIFSAFVLIILIGGGWYYWFSTSQPEAPAEAAPAIQVRTIIPYAKASTVAIGGEDDPIALISAKLAVSNPGLGNVFALIPVASAGAAEPAPVESVLGQTDAPSRLMRSLGDEYMIGLYAYDMESPFLLLRNTFFQNAFAGMLEWEKEMKEDLLPLVRIPMPEETLTSDVDAFEDMVVSNVDARALRNAEGEVILVYAFADKDTIAITTSVNSLRYLLDRILAVRTIQ